MTSPAVIIKEKTAYQFWLILHRNFPKTERYGIGKRIDNLFLEVLELSFTASYLPPAEKIIFLGKPISRLDILKFFLQIAWENKIVPDAKYIDLSAKLEEIGRMLGGWKKGLQKNSRQTNGRKYLSFGKTPGCQHSTHSDSQQSWHSRSSRRHSSCS